MHSLALTLPQLCFSVVAVLGLAFFLLSRRRFDWYSVAFLSAVVYFLPGFFGYVLLPRTESRAALVAVPIVQEVYLLMMTVLVAVVAGALLFDLSGLERMRVFRRLEGSAWTPYVALGLALVALGLTVVTVGAPLFSADKATLLPLLGRWHHIFVAASLVGLVSSWSERRLYLVAIFAGLLVFDLYLGFRYPFAIGTIALFCLWLAEQGRQRLVFQHWGVGVLAALAATFFFVVKRLVAPLRLGNWDLVFAKLARPTEYLAAITESEPFKTQAVLNEVVLRDIRVGLGHLSSLRGSLVFLGPELGLDVRSFGDEVVSQQLFPDARAGVASNIWAETWSTGGWGLIVVALIIWILALGLLTCLLRAPDPSLKALAAVLGGYWAFYLHRNDLLFQITLSRRVVAVSLVVLVAAMVAYALSHRFRVVDRTEGRAHELPP